MNRTEQIRLGCSKQENPRGSWVFLRFLFSAIHNHRIFCWADVGKNPEMPRFSWLLLGWISICRAPMLLCASYFLGSVRRSGRKGKYYAICLLLFQWNFSLSLALSLFAAPGSCYFESQHKIRPMNLKAELSSADSNCPFISYVDSLVFAYVDSLFFLLGFFLAGKSPKRASRAASSISACRAASSCVIKSTNDGKKIKSDETS